MTEDNETTPLKKVSAVIIDDDKNTKLHYSAATGKEQDLLEDLENEKKIDIENYLGWTPLMMACRNGHLNIVQLLLDRRADATKKNKYGMSVFLVSVSSGNVEIVHLILQHLLCGGVSRQSMQKLFSPLSLAIIFCHQHILRYLIEQHFDLNAATPVTGITPLMFAAAMENCKAFTLLKNKGANVTLKNYIGFTANGIIQFRNQKLEGKHKDTNYSNNSPNLTASGPHMQPHQGPIPPYIVISPQPTFFQVPPNELLTSHIRKSSNTLSPGYYFTPNVTPITPVSFLPTPQMFFPPDFSSNQIFGASPIPSYLNTSNDFLNTKMNSGNIYISPVPQNINYSSPCV